jgi:hypothetical protein
MRCQAKQSAIDEVGRCASASVRIVLTYRPDQMLQVGHVGEGPLDLIVQCVTLAAARGKGEEPDVYRGSEMA